MRALVGVGGRRKRYADIEGVSDLQEVSDPATREDETRRSALEWAGDNVALVIVGLLVAVIGGVFLAVNAARFVPAIVSNPWIQRGVAAVALLAIGYRGGFARGVSALGKTDYCVLLEDGDVTVFQGQHIESSAGNPLFIPIKGFIGGRPRFYTHADIGGALLDRPEVDPDQPAVIQLRTQQVKRFETDVGTFIVQLTAGLEPVRFSEASLDATPPDFGDKSTITDLKDELEEAVVQKDHYEEKAARMRDRLEALMDDISTTREEIREEEVERLERVLAVAYGRRNPQDETDEQIGVATAGAATGNGHLDQQTQQALQQVDDNLSEDDDDE